ncbi:MULTISPECIES: GntR family transcriptional regulator [unclassified Streptomyces]|uniref:GntR family transcriptional regulator n=1 Tax=unclassified Streptomyces TaxID=2593676 RepID=UPI0037B37A1D
MTRTCTTSPSSPAAAVHGAPSTPVAVRAVRDRITAGYYLPGARLTLRELATSTSHDPTALRPALDHLATTGLVTGRWRVADPHPEHRTARARALLSGMIDRGAWPAGTTLPALSVLVRLLLTEGAHIAQALGELADEGVLDLAAKGPARVLPAPADARARAPWSPGEEELLDALPSSTRPGAAHDGYTLHLVRHAARKRWKGGVCLPPIAMAEQEGRQAETVHRLITRAFEATVRRAPDFLPDVRSAAAQVMACHALPRTGALYERLYRLATLATALAHLADALAAPAATRDHPAPAPSARPAHTSERS